MILFLDHDVEKTKPEKCDIMKALRTSTMLPLLLLLFAFIYFLNIYYLFIYLYLFLSTANDTISLLKVYVMLQYAPME